LFLFFHAEAGIRAFHVTGVQTCALPIYLVYVPSTIPVVEDRNKPTASLSSDVRLKNDLLIRGAISRFVEERDLSLDLVYMRLNSNMNSVEQRVKQMSIMLQQFSS